jgi:hypothetical protein
LRCRRPGGRALTSPTAHRPTRPPGGPTPTAHRPPPNAHRPPPNAHRPPPTAQRPPANAHRPPRPGGGHRPPPVLWPSCPPLPGGPCRPAPSSPRPPAPLCSAAPRPAPLRSGNVFGRLGERPRCPAQRPPNFCLRHPPANAQRGLGGGGPPPTAQRSAQRNPGGAHRPAPGALGPGQPGAAAQGSRRSCTPPGGPPARGPSRGQATSLPTPLR